MSWAAGTFTRADGTTGCQDKETAGVGILSVDMDGRLNDLATGINACLPHNGTKAASANLPMGGFKVTGAGNATARTDLMTLGQMQDSGGIITLTPVGGTAAAITATAPYSLGAYVHGMYVLLSPASGNDAGCTLNVNSLGAKPIVTQNPLNAPILGGQLYQYALYVLRYDSGSGGQWILLTTTDHLSINQTVAAAGTTQGTATALTFVNNIVTSASVAARSVKMPSALLGRAVNILHKSGYGSPIYIFPASGEKFLMQATDAKMDLNDNSIAQLRCLQTGVWCGTYGLTA